MEGLLLQHNTTPHTDCSRCLGCYLLVLCALAMVMSPLCQMIISANTSTKQHRLHLELGGHSNIQNEEDKAW